jgi:hypothetical protein
LTDSEGLEHPVQVTAASVYEAAVLALSEFPFGGVGRSNFGRIWTCETSMRWTGQASGYERIHEADIAKLRESGRESAYYARLRTDGPHRWLLVCATPIMEAEQVRPPRTDGEPFRLRRRKIWKMTLRAAFATLTEASQSRITALDERFE